MSDARDPAATDDADSADNIDKLLTALTTEHFVLQSVRGGISGEATSRATLYLSALSASLVALGFVIGLYATERGSRPLIGVAGIVSQSTPQCSSRRSR